MAHPPAVSAAETMVEKGNIVLKQCEDYMTAKKAEFEDVK